MNPERALITLLTRYSATVSQTQNVFFFFIIHPVERSTNPIRLQFLLMRFEVFL